MLAMYASTCNNVYWSCRFMFLLITMTLMYHCAVVQCAVYVNYNQNLEVKFARRLYLRIKLKLAHRI